ncbi:MAG: hypothetical protein AAGN82_15540 [Myxococcota bacterium]
MRKLFRRPKKGRSQARAAMVPTTVALVVASSPSVNAQVTPTPADSSVAQENDAETPPPAPPARATPGGPRRVQLLPDIDLDGGVARALEPEAWIGFGRLRLGVLTWIEPSTPVASPVLVSVGATYGLSSFSPAEVGVETELLHLGSGFWFQGAGAVDLVDPGPVWRVAAGWSVLGVEVQNRTFPDDDRLPSDPSRTFVIGGKLRAPIGPLLKLFLY